MKLTRNFLVIACLQTMLLGQVNVQSPCFAYLENGDVYASCSGEVVRLTRTRDASDFAIADTGSTLAVKRERVVGRTKDGNGVIVDCNVRLYSLSADTLPRTMVDHGCGELFSSCGTLLRQDRTEEPEDILTRTQIDIEGLKSFLCSANKTVVAGWRERCCHDFLVRGPSVSQAEPIVDGASVSPAGVVAYVSSGLSGPSSENSLCVINNAGNRRCLKDADAFGKLSVSDSGEVLFTTHTEGGCRYRKNSIIRAIPPEFGDDQCLGVAIWIPGSAKQLVKDLVQRPQWLTSEAWFGIRSCVKSKNCSAKLGH